MRRPVVVGVDGSPSAVAAAHYAASLAQRKDAPLLVLQVFETMFYGYGPLSFAATYALADEQLREAAGRQLTETVTEIRDAHPGLEVDWQLRQGHAAATLIAESQEATATVVGSHGMGGFTGLILGSVAAQVAAHAHGAVVVARPAADPMGPVLVGYDGSPGAQAALGYAVQEALALKAPLIVANVYWEEPWGFKPTPVPDPAITALHKAEQLLADALELPLEEHPDLQVEYRPIHELDPEHSLVEESARAGLTVVGCRGRGGFAGLLLGSVSQTLIHHAGGPVAVIHPSEHE